MFLPLTFISLELPQKRIFSGAFVKNNCFHGIVLSLVLTMRYHGTLILPRKIQCITKMPGYNNESQWRDYKGRREKGAEGGMT